MTGVAIPKEHPLDDRFTWDVFISYASPDRARAREFYQRIQGQVRCFFDCESLKAGDRWMDVLPNTLAESKVTAVLVSNATQGSHYQEEECARAIAYARDRSQDRRVVPIYLDGIPGRTDWNLFGLNVLQGIGLPESNGWDGVVSRFMSAYGDTRPGAIAAPGHILLRFSQRFVEPHEIPEAIIEIYAKQFTATRAELFLAKANSFRRESDSQGTIIDFIDLPPIANVPPLSWWQSVFNEARKHGARMVAALLLTSTRLEFSKEVNAMRENLLNSL